MTIEQLREAYQAMPFRPFTLHVADGREISIVGRDYILATPSGKIVVAFESSGRMHLLDSPQITGFQFIDRSNGKRRKRR